MYFDYHERKTEEDAIVGEPSVIIPIKEVLSGMYKDIDLNLLATIMASMNRSGISYVTQEQLSKQIGVSIPTINKRVNKLLNARINGQPLLLREKLKKRGNIQSSKYTLPNVDYGIPEVEHLMPVVVEEVKEVEVKGSYNAKSVINYWCEGYEEKFGQPYMVMWGRDATVVKNKIVKMYDEETVKVVIDYVMDNYLVKWGTKQYPRPTLGQLCGWMFNSALAFVDTQKVEVVSADELDRYYDGAEEEF